MYWISGKWMGSVTKTLRKYEIKTTSMQERRLADEFARVEALRDSKGRAKADFSWIHNG
jgi:hypothetical protein